MKTVFLIPRPGVKIRDPIGGTHIPEAGGERMINSYYNRRIKDGDLFIRDDSPSAPPAVVVNQDSHGKTGGKSNSSKGDNK